jgi:hypothetical protein
MEKEQARGYIFESIILRLIKRNGYVNTRRGRLPGRGTSHDIDAYGTYSFPIPFVHPIRLLSEAKCRTSNPVELPEVRSFYGAIQDISQNYFIRQGHTRNINNRFTDSGCMFSSTSFTKDAQDFAWAHNIFLFSFSSIDAVTRILPSIDEFLRLRRLNTTKKQLLDRFWEWERRHRIRFPDIAIGIINSFYPVVLVGQSGWVKNLRLNMPPDNDLIEGRKTHRFPQNYETRYNLLIEERGVAFTLPNYIANKINKRIDGALPGQKIFNVDIPIIIRKKRNTIRRLASIDFVLDH